MRYMNQSRSMTLNISAVAEDTKDNGKSVDDDDDDEKDKTLDDQ